MEKFFNLRNESGLVQPDGASVRRARLMAGLTQAEVGRRMRVLGYYLPQPHVSKLEHGEYPWGFTERMAAALAAALGVALSDVTESRLLTRAEEQRIQELVTST